MDKKTVASLFLLAACLLSASPLCAEDGGAQATATPAAAQSASDLAAAGAQASPDATATPQLTPTPTPAPTATPSPTPFTPQLPSEEELAAAGIGDRILMRGLEGSDVALMQQRLYDLGYYTGDIDGKFGLQTRTAVRDFQRAHGLEKIDGKAGPETLGRLFSEDVVIQPTPTATPDVANAPFDMESTVLTVAGTDVTLMTGVDETGERLYPLCGIAEVLGYDYTHENGAWQLTREEDGAEIAIMTQGETGLCENAMIAYDGVISLADAQNRVYAYGAEAYVTAPLLAQMGFDVQDASASAAGA